VITPSQALHHEGVLDLHPSLILHLFAAPGISHSELEMY